MCTYIYIYICLCVCDRCIQRRISGEGQGSGQVLTLSPLKTPWFPRKVFQVLQDWERWIVGDSESWVALAAFSLACF